MSASSDAGPVVQIIVYNNPDLLPPAINAVRVLARASFSVKMISRDYRNEWDIAYPPEIEHHRIPKRARSSWREYASFILQVFRLADPSMAVVVGHDMHGFLAARLLTTLYRRPLIYHCHDFMDRSRSLSFGGRVVRAFEHRFARTADLIVVPDRARAAAMAQELHLSAPPLVVANAPLDRPPAASGALRAALRERGFDFERIVLRQGVLGPGHAIEATIRSIPYWSNRRWGFVLLGFAEQSYVERLNALATSLRVEKQLAILPAVGYDQVASYTPDADLGHALYDPVNINHVHMGTASNKTLEYMAAGLPLLLSDRPSSRALLDRYRCGLVADESSPHSIARAVNQLLGDPVRSRTMGEAGAAAFERELCYEPQFAPVLEAITALTQCGVEAVEPC